MKIVKINNLVDMGGQCDYKGLDINHFVAGKQIYRLYNGANECAIVTRQDDIPAHEDITLIDDAEYADFTALVESEVSPRPEDVIAKLQAENEQLKADLELTNQALDYIAMNMPKA